MSVLQRVVKPFTRKGKKVLMKREPQIIEGPKKAVFFQGRKCSEKLRRLLKDMYDIKKPDSLMLNKKNDITIFENVTPVENICKKHETPVFLMGSHSKKRPDNLVIGLREFAASKISLGTKPVLIFNGLQWEQTDKMRHLKSIFIDFFHRETVDAVRLQGIEHTISLNATSEGKILLRSYKVLLKKSGCRTPRVELEEIGPRVDFALRRTRLPTEDLIKEACRKPRELKVIKKKNISTDKLGTTHSTIHVGKQEINKLQTRKMKGLKKTPVEKKAERAAKKRSIKVNKEEIEPVKKQKRG
ncbi:unnamed protein product [Brassicogethes aeneus]|uniref:Ribosome production factor 2 homolog n=1 Tax=Brassicogethes aeneus TaxID=1431903 RepID=A0A9P0B0C6_BRAAE|nr:unnamed protein product [Brassicogethes aeneus]